MADMERVATPFVSLADTLHFALERRVVIEQAKGTR